MKKIDCGVNWGTGKAYFFNKNEYIRFDIAEGKADEGFPKVIDQNSWPGMSFPEVHAAVNFGNGKVYFFYKDEYIRFDIAGHRADGGYPKRVDESTWPGVGIRNIDGIANWGNGKVYIFGDENYTRFDIQSNRTDSGFPRVINSNTWPGLSVNRLDTVVDWENGKAIFIFEDQFFQYDKNNDHVDSGYPRVINENTWPGLKFSDDEGARLNKGVKLVGQHSEFLSVNEYLQTTNGFFKLIYQGDGNLVLYRTDTNQALWATGTNGQAPGKVYMQSDSHFVVYNSGGGAIWASGVYGGQYGNSTLNLTEEGNLEVRDQYGQVIWQTGTTQVLPEPEPEPEPIKETKEDHSDAGKNSKGTEEDKTKTDEVDTSASSDDTAFDPAQNVATDLAEVKFDATVIQKEGIEIGEGETEFGVVEFKNTSDQLLIDHDPILDNSIFTIELWVKPEEIDSNWQPVITKQDSEGRKRSFGIFICPDSMHLNFGVQTEDGRWNSYVSKSPMVLGGWNHLVLSFDGRQLTFYVNKELDSVVPLEQKLSFNEESIKIGSYGNNYPSFKGKLFDLRIWNLLRYNLNISDNFDQNPSGKTGLVAAWNGLNLQGDNLTDLSVNNLKINFSGASLIKEQNASNVISTGLSVDTLEIGKLQHVKRAPAQADLRVLMIDVETGILYCE